MSDTSDSGAAHDADDKGGAVPEHLVGYFGNAKTPGGDTTPRKLKRGVGNGVCYIKQVGVEERLPWYETDVQALDDTGVKYANIVSFMDVSATAAAALPRRARRASRLACAACTRTAPAPVDACGCTHAVRSSRAWRQ